MKKISLPTPRITKGQFLKYLKNSKNQTSKKSNFKNGYRSKQRILAKESQMVEKHLRKCSISLAIREKQTKTTLRFHFTRVRMAKINNISDTHAGEDVKKGNTPPLLVECKLVQSLWKSVQQYLRKLEIDLPQDSAIPLGHIPKGCSIIPQGHLFNYIQSSFIHNDQKLEKNLDVPQLKNG